MLVFYNMSIPHDEGESVKQKPVPLAWQSQLPPGRSISTPRHSSSALSEQTAFRIRDPDICSPLQHNTLTEGVSYQSKDQQFVFEKRKRYLESECFAGWTFIAHA